MTGTDLEPRDDLGPSQELTRLPALTLVPDTTAADLIDRLDVIRGAMEQAMTRDVDYGVIPGTGKKPTLLKPGAEKLAVLFQMDVQIENEKIWGDDEHLTVISRATVYHIPTGTRIASGEGMCSTRETKYAFRQADRMCPACGTAAIIKGKAEYGGGFVCFKKKGGCGTKFRDDDAAITSQPTGQAPNPNIADTYNTVDKMASKRARVDAILAATGASALFTQDIEDFQGSGEPTAADRPATAKPVASGSPVPQAGTTAAEPAAPADKYSSSGGASTPAEHWPQREVELPETPFTEAGEKAVLDFASEAQKKKLNVLVGKLRTAKHDPTPWIYETHHRAAAGIAGEEMGHWAPLRDRLTRREASLLIDKLEKYATSLEAQA